MVFNPPGFRGVSALFVALVTACPAALAFQSSPNLTITSKTRPAMPGVDLGAPVLRIESNLVMIPAQVTNGIGAPVMNLTREDFEVFEDGIPQEVRYFMREDAPVSVGILLDASGSMKDKQEKAAEAAQRFFQTANREDEFFLVQFGDRAKVTVPFTTDSQEIYDRVRRARPFGRTSLFDAVKLALQTMKSARYSRKALLIISDGGDNQSRSTFLSVRGAMMESDVQLYAVGIFGDSESPEEREGPDLLERLTEVTGGWCFPVVSIADLPEVAARIGEQLRNQYLLGYNSTVEVRDGKYRKVHLRIAGEASRYRVSYRRGYYAPSY